MHHHVLAILIASQAISRIMVAWQPVGLAMGVYDMVARYTQQREQFGAPIASYQITQEKMQRMLVCVGGYVHMLYDQPPCHYCF